MTNDKKKRVEAITAREVDFAQWYTDVVTKAELVDYSSVRGCMILRPLGAALWEAVQSGLDRRFKETGHENVLMPMFIPENLLQKEADHVEGFAPEVAWVTHGGGEKLAERLAVRPTSETLFCEHYAKVIQSYRDLPKLYNQWVSVVRWEKTTRPFLRSLEFYWQEGHTAHENREQAMEETLRMLDVYRDFAREELAIPVIQGRKTDKEKFAGAEETYTIEAMMHDGKALQSGTTHYFGDGFAKAFDITYSDRENQLRHVHQTSWGMSTRIIGALIMVHSDDSGLVLPPRIAPTQIVLVPVAQHKEGVLERARALCAELKARGLRVALDDSDKSPGWKFSEHEMKGVPLRLELGPRDIADGSALVVRRDTGEKRSLPLAGLGEALAELLRTMQADLLARATERLNSRIYEARDWEEFKGLIAERPGFVRAMWCGDRACEDRIKEETTATSRCIPFDGAALDTGCVCCGKEARHLVLWGKAY